jgi:hypothetical protein
LQYLSAIEGSKVDGDLPYWNINGYEAIISPGGSGSDTPADATWRASYQAENATITGSGWNINTEGTPGNPGGFATSGNQDVGGLRTGSSTVIAFHTSVPRTGDYRVSVFDDSYCHASDVNGPANVFLRRRMRDQRQEAGEPPPALSQHDQAASRAGFPSTPPGGPGRERRAATELTRPVIRPTTRPRPGRCSSPSARKCRCGRRRRPRSAAGSGASGAGSTGR